MGKETTWIRLRNWIEGKILDHMPRWLAEIGFWRVWLDTVPEDERDTEKFVVAEILERWTLMK